MVKKVIHQLIDDLDGSEAAETIPFSIDGTHYEIDLSLSHIAEIRSSLAPFIGAGRRIGGRVRSGRSAWLEPAAKSEPTPDRDKETRRAAREWAVSKGMKVSDRGRLKQEILDGYLAETGNGGVSQPAIFSHA